MLKDVHEVILSSCIVDGKAYFFQVLILLHVVIIIGDVPSEWISEGQQELRVRMFPDETRGVRVELGPDISEMLAEVSVHEFVLSVCCEFERLQNNCDEEAKEYG